MSADIISLISTQSSSIQGTFDVPGDKSVSHRSLILGSIAVGQTVVSGLLEGDDVSNKTGDADCGAQIEKGDDYIINGLGLGGLTAPTKPLDLGNSGTAVRLLLGLIAGQSLTATFIGDASLSKRPMRRITDPLLEMGAQIEVADGGTLPCDRNWLARTACHRLCPKSGICPD